MPEAHFRGTFDSPYKQETRTLPEGIYTPCPCEKVEITLRPEDLLRLVERGKQGVQGAFLRTMYGDDEVHCGKMFFEIGRTKSRDPAEMRLPVGAIRIDSSPRYNVRITDEGITLLGKIKRVSGRCIFDGVPFQQGVPLSVSIAGNGWDSYSIRSQLSVAG